VSAVQGLLGFDLAREHRPSLILLDLQLPDIQGDEVLRRLKADPATRRIPVVMLSAEASPRRIQQLLDAGATAYLTKPLDIRRFLELTTRILNGAELAVANEREPA
jgi:CheY-like chemotaxis protein